MRISMEEAAHQDLLQVSLKEFLGQRVAVDVQPSHRAERGDLGALNVIHGEHIARGVIRHRQRNPDSRKPLEAFGEGGEIGSLMVIVQLVEQGGFEFTENFYELVTTADAGV